MDGGSVISGEDASFFISNYPKHKEIYVFVLYYFIKIYLFINCE